LNLLRHGEPPIVYFGGSISSIALSPGLEERGLNFEDGNDSIDHSSCHLKTGGNANDLRLAESLDIKKLLKGLVCHTSEALKALDYCLGCLVIG